MSDDDILLSLIGGDPNAMLTPNMIAASNVATAYGTRPRTNPLQRNGGSVYALTPSPKAMENPNGQSNKSDYGVNEI